MLDADLRLPVSVEAEAAILGAVLLDNGHYGEAMLHLSPRDFSLDAHRRIFERMGALFTQGRAVDLVTLSEELRRANETAAVGGIAYVASLTEGLPRRPSIAEYVRIVKEKSLLRQTIGAAHRIASSAASPAGSANQVLSGAESDLRKIADQAFDGGLETISGYIAGAYPRIDSLFERSARMSGVGTGFERLDALTAGFQPREMIILGARPAIGKTAIAANIAEQAAIEGKTVAFFSLEMPKKALIDRICCARARVPLGDYRHGRLGPAQKKHFLQALAEIGSTPLYIDDQPAQTAFAIEAKAARLKSQAGLDLVLIDYLGLMTGERKPYENREQEVAGISRAVKAMAKRLEAPVILLAQLNRELYKRTDKRPLLSDLRESGAIEQDADLVLFLHREDYYNREDPSLAGKGELIVAKARNGPLGTVDLYYDAEICRFVSAGVRSA